MTPGELVGMVTGIGALIVSVFTLVRGWMADRRKAVLDERNSKIEEAAKVVLSYSQLCDDLQRQIEANNAEIARLRQELAELRTQSQIDREAWEAERADLQAQIEELQRENKRLRSELEKLSRGGG